MEHLRSYCTFHSLSGPQVAKSSWMSSSETLYSRLLMILLRQASGWALSGLAPHQQPRCLQAAVNSEPSKNVASVASANFPCQQIAKQPPT